MQKELLFTELVYCIASMLPVTYESRVEADNVTAARAFRYTYDSKGNITAVYDTTTTPETLQARYAYDEAGQLVREDNAQLSRTVTYTYDKGGNITEKSVYPFTTGTVSTATDTIAYTYDSTWKDKLTSYDGTTLTYDEIGNPWDYTHDRFLWWSARELRYAYLENGGFVEYHYNENGLLSLKKVYDDNGIDSDNYYYFWSDDGRLLAYTVDAYGSEELYSVLVLYNSDKEPIGFTVDEDTYYYLKNIQGDVLCVTDAEGTPIVNYTYDAWGMMTAAPASQNVSNTVLARVAFLNPVTYRGYLYDYELGLYYLQSRYYDPETGRFLSIEVACDSGTSIVSANTYNYGENCPIVIENPNGEDGRYCHFFGFERSTGFFTQWKSQENAFQKIFGYGDIYDYAADNLHLFSIDGLCSEFNHGDDYWRVELWKGRYGPYIGGEIGFYTYQDTFYNRLIEKIFPQKMVKSFTIYEASKKLFDMEFIVYAVNNSVEGERLETKIKMPKTPHWWLAGMIWNDLLLSINTESANLQMTAAITFSDELMATSFCQNLYSTINTGFWDTDPNDETVYIKWVTKEQYLNWEELKYIYEINQAA